MLLILCLRSDKWVENKYCHLVFGCTLIRGCWILEKIISVCHFLLFWSNHVLGKTRFQTHQSCGTFCLHSKFIKTWRWKESVRDERQKLWHHVFKWHSTRSRWSNVYDFLKVGCECFDLSYRPDLKCLLALSILQRLLL